MGSKAYHRQYYLDRRERYLAEAKERRQRDVEIYQTWKTVRGCAVCGEDKHWRLEPHHWDPSTKECNPNPSVGHGKMLRELKKCVVLCANCHNDVHHILRTRGETCTSKSLIEKLKRQKAGRTTPSASSRTNTCITSMDPVYLPQYAVLQQAWQMDT